MNQLLERRRVILSQLFNSRIEIGRGYEVKWKSS